MKYRFFQIILLLLFAYALPVIISVESGIYETNFLSQPAVSQDHIAFVYSGDLWAADIDGKNAKRLTSDEGIESEPAFSLFLSMAVSGEMNQLTHYTDFPVLRVSCSTDTIIYDRAGQLHIYDPRNGQSRKLEIDVSTDRQEIRPRYVKGARYIRSASISPSGARAVFEFRGEIISVPAEKGVA